MDKVLIEKIALKILEAEAVEIRDIDKGEEPFMYSSGNWGPGYINIKNLVGRKKLIRFLTRQLAEKVAERVPHLNFVAGNVTGGVIPGWLISEYLETILGRAVPYVYVRETRKKGGHKELITGIKDNPEIHKGDKVIVVEELINFAQTICNSADSLRKAGYTVSHAACILFYNNPQAIKALKEHKIEIVYLLTLPQLLEMAEKHRTHPLKAILDYREFLKDPLKWQAKHGLEPVKEGGTL